MSFSRWQKLMAASTVKAVLRTCVCGASTAIEGFPMPLNHVLHIRPVSRIRENRFPHLCCRKTAANRQREDVDDVIGILPQDVRAQNPVRTFFDENLITRSFLAYSAR